MKLNILLIATVVVSVFSNASADVGALRGLTRLFDRFDSGPPTEVESSGNAKGLQVKMKGNPSSVTTGDLEEYGEVLFDFVLGFMPETLTVEVTEKTSLRRNLKEQRCPPRTYTCNRRDYGDPIYSCGSDCNPDDGDRRNLQKVTTEEANEFLAGWCDENSSNTACDALSVDSIIF
jgi:hypothetical protein